MELHNLKTEWAQVSEQLQETLPDLPSAEVQSVYQSMPYKRLIYNNLLELGFSAMGVPVVGLAMLLMDPQGYLPAGVKWLAWITTFVLLVPSFALFRAIHQPDASLSTVSYLKSVSSRIRFYRIYQVVMNFFLCMIICIPGFLTSRKWILTLDGETFEGVINFPEPYFTQYVLATGALSIVMSIFAAAWGYTAYAIFYKKRKGALDRIISGFEGQAG
ncbi:hypothetical protein KFE98_04870 [bacterium SCSIO 12741]|nr:hypothetical protein KFE98_04870 [bacterium SCSIO 12741]